MNTAAKIIEEEPTLTLKQLASMLDILEGGAPTILTKKLYFFQVCSKWVPQFLMNEMKVECVWVCKFWRDHWVEHEKSFNDVITIDES